MPAFHPSAKIKLKLVLDEFANPFKPKPSKPPKKPTTLLKGVKDERDPLTWKEEPDALTGVTRYVLSSSDTSTAPSSIASKDSRGLTHEIGGIIPVEATWKQTGIRQADSLSCKIRWIDFPIDPRCVRAVAVEFYLGCVTAEDYARGLGGAMRLGEGPQGVAEPLNVVPDVYADARGNLRSNLRFQGWVDVYSLEWGEGEPMVTFECKDNTILLIKQEAPSKLVASAINDDVAIDEAIAGYLAHFPQFEGLTVEYRPGNVARQDIPRLKKVLAKTAYVPELGPQQSKGGGGSEKLSVWDYLTDVCGAIGHTIRVDGTSIIIQKASTMLRTKSEPRSDDPYEARATADGDFPVRAMIFGRNLSELKMKREYNKKEPSNIEVRCYDPHRKTVLVARSPKDLADRVDQHLPGDKSEQKWTVIRVAGIRDKDILQDIADEAFEQLGRSELTATMKTKDVWSWGGDSLDPDLLDLKVGDPVEVLLHRGADFSTMSYIEKSLTVQEQNEQILTRLGYSDEFAKAYAKAYTDAGFQRAFRTREMQAEWNESGVTLDITAANYVTVRIEKDPPKEDTEADQTMASPEPTNKTAPGGKLNTNPNTRLLDAIAKDNAAQAAFEAALKGGV